MPRYCPAPGRSCDCRRAGAVPPAWPQLARPWGRTIAIGVPPFFRGHADCVAGPPARPARSTSRVLPAPGFTLQTAAFNAPSLRHPTHRAHPPSLSSPDHPSSFVPHPCLRQQPPASSTCRRPHLPAVDLPSLTQPVRGPLEDRAFVGGTIPWVTSLFKRPRRCKTTPCILKQPESPMNRQWPEYFPAQNDSVMRG